MAAQNLSETALDAKLERAIRELDRTTNGHALRRVREALDELDSERYGHLVNMIGYVQDELDG